MYSLIERFKCFFHMPQDILITSRPTAGLLEKPWRRPLFGFNMKPQPGMGSWNLTATFCHRCGDLIEDSAYSHEHSWWHRPLRGSWNYEHPSHKRRNSDDINPDHNQWLEEVRDWAKGHKKGLISRSIDGLGAGDCQFHSEQEAQETLEPFGLELKRVKDPHCSSSWYIMRSVALPESLLEAP